MRLLLLLSLCMFQVFAGTTTLNQYCASRAQVLSTIGWQFVPSKVTRYKDSYFFSGQTRIEEVTLTLNSADDIAAVAKVIAQGGSSPPEVIQKQIEAKMGAGEPILLKDLLPEFPRKRTNTFSTCMGANCWNATLNWHDPSIGVKDTNEVELTNYLTRNYQQLGSGEKLLFGDVISVRVADGGFVHTAIYIDDNLLWHKASSNRSDPWTFESVNQVLEYYTQKYRREGVYIDFFRHKRDSFAPNSKR